MRYNMERGNKKLNTPTPHKNTMKTNMKNLSAVIFSLSIFALSSSLFGQVTYPPTVQVPVTFYDYHSNGSNPEYQPKAVNGGYDYGRHLNMVAPTIIPETGNPSLGSTPYWNCDVAKWFTPWQSGDFTIPNYQNTRTCSNRDSTVNYDTAFKNVVIPTELTFRYVAGTPGTYTYDNSNFFLLDNQGLGNEGRSHNYSFSMELHWQFTMTQGLKFYFRGDDDVWVYINGKLVMDIGGIHSAISDSIIVDNLGLTNGQQYWFDFFYCERMTSESSIKITSNIIAAQPSRIDMSVNPNFDTIPAGRSISYNAAIVDQTNDTIHDYDQAITWTLTPAGTRSYLDQTNGVANTFHAVDAYYTYYITAILNTATRYGQVNIKWVDTVYVKPDSAANLFIEANSDSMVSLRAPARMGTTSMSSTTLNDSVYAVLRDRFGNWVSHATLASWLSRDATVATVAPGRLPLGEGVLTRIAATGDTTFIRASQVVNSRTLADSLRVIISDMVYSKIQIYIISGGVKDIDTLKMRTDQDTTLRARGLRADGSGLWDELSVDWHSSPNMTFNNVPAQGKTWNFHPNDTATGIIYISYSSASVLRDTIKAFFGPGLPSREALYPLPGLPNTAANTVLPGSITIAAGTPLQIVAKLFDLRNLWLSAYESPSASFTWTIAEVQGTGSTGSLSTSTGFLTVFTPRKAYNSVKITATFQMAGITVPPQSILITVIPGPPNHIVIEGDTSKFTSPNSDNPIGTITIGSRDTSGLAYAILRDSLGNWVMCSNSTEWQSFDTNQAKVFVRNAEIGEGIIIRKTQSGRTYVTAKNLNNSGPGFIDTALVILSSISYDSLRVVVRDTIQIQNLTMRTDQDTIIQVQGKRSDNHLWEAVPADWFIAPDIQTSTAPPKSVNSWAFSPTDTGRGIIVVNLGTAVPDSITIYFVHGLPFSIILYPSPGKPDLNNMPFVSPTIPVIDTAGKPLRLVAKIFDKYGVWIGDYERTNAPINWTMQELTGNPPTGSLTDAIGYLTNFKPLRAYNTLYIVATFDTAGYQKFSDSILVKVVPGKPAQLVIEEDQNWQASPNNSRPVNRIQIDSTETYRYVYAMIRDSLGNFVNYSQITSWFSQNNTVVNANEGLTSVGQGVIKRLTSGDSTFVIAVSGEYPGLADTIAVIVLKYFYTELRIVVRETVPIEYLGMNTNQDTTLFVLGLRSDTTMWEPVSVRWENSTGLVIDPTAPERSQKWKFSPVVPAVTGWIRVTLGNDVKTKPDTVAIKFDAGPPTKIEITLITPPDRRIAGDTIVAVVKVYNKDGLYPDKLCDTTVHQESLGKGNTNQDPLVIIDGMSSNLNRIPSTNYVSPECFISGLDTVKYILYNATEGKDTLQKLYVNIDSLTASTDPFNVLPAKLNSVAIQDFKGIDLDSVHLGWPDSSQVFFVVGYDRFGNKVVLKNGATWVATDGLHPIDKSVNVTRIFYNADSILVKRDESGFIIAAVLDSSGHRIADSVKVDIRGPLTSLTAAVTGDADGDGYLDHIVLHFDKEATFPSDINPKTAFTITYSNKDGMNVQFVVDSIRGMSGTGLTDSVFTVYFAENTAGSTKLQTAWTPTITYNGNLKGVSPINNNSTIDGAGPVIWKVIKDSKSVYTTKDDEITVIFSEPIQATDGSGFKTGTQPNLVFYVWTQDTSGHFLRDSINLPLSDIKYFNGQMTDANQTQVTFTMTNGKDISALNFFSIRVDSSAIYDKAAENPNNPDNPSLLFNNLPAANNQPVRVQVISNIPEKLLVGPNPSVPTFLHERPGELNFVNNPNARRWVGTEHAATVLNFLVDVDMDASLKIAGNLAIYDVVGNPVQTAKNDDILKGTGWLAGTGIHNFDIYWNQSNAKGMKVAPGSYFAIVHIVIQKAHSTEKRTFSANVGVAR
jgi:fibro-slime domain-containing protein